LKYGLLPVFDLLPAILTGGGVFDVCNKAGMTPHLFRHAKSDIP
jgi:hypothetical protein